VVVIGKIIIDEYRGSKTTASSVTVGGGGPQAAWGAAAALAIMDSGMGKQPVTLWGPVGDLDWTDREDSALRSDLEDCLSAINLYRGPNLRTPRIELYHDEDQTIQWRPLQDSFGESGAEKLWAWSGPNATGLVEQVCPDLVNMASDNDSQGAKDSSANKEVSLVVHVLGEMGLKSPGGGHDSSLLADPGWSTYGSGVLKSLEPIIFPDSPDGGLTDATANGALDRILRTCARLTRSYTMR
jgi:hypothetical protein